MPFRVRDILLVSSAYDAFLLQEDGRLDERLHTAYTELSHSVAPRIFHVTSVARVLELLDERSFDLVITVVRLEDGDAARLGRLVKQRHPKLPVVLLAFDEAELAHPSGSAAVAALDRVFLWTGDARILVAAIKLIEDERNVDHDVGAAGVRAIIVVEDKVRPYSTFLAALYAELMAQSLTLLAEGLNDAHRRMRMRARPKLLLATTFEEAAACLDRLKDHVLAVISDVRFPRGGREDPDAGFDLVKRVRADSADLPILLQSADTGIEQRVAGLGVWYVPKNSPNTLERIRRFLKEALGFGEFVFRLPDRTEVGRAADIYEMTRMLATVPKESVEYHASRNHFSMWLDARGRFTLAGRVRPVRAAEFRDAEALRAYLIEVLREELNDEQEGVIADYSPKQRGTERPFVRLGKGSIGGKGRGLAFVGSMLAREHLADRFPGLAIAIPRTVVIGTSEFDRFLDDNAIARATLHVMDEIEVKRRFLAGTLGADLVRDLETTVSGLAGPLAVRSSSLLEDSRFSPFAGVYATYMLPNVHPDPAVRLHELGQAIKAVYASTFSTGAKSYLAQTPHSPEDERMGIVIQELVGQRYGDRFYPHAAGVAQSYNYYPVGSQSADDGVAVLALGLGHTVVSGMVALRFCPACPGVLPQMASVRSFVKSSQSRFYALDLARAELDFLADDASLLTSFDLTAAERDGTLAKVGSVYSAADDALRDNLSAPGARVVTFNNVLKWRAVPLAEALAELLRVFRRGLGTDVEIEFAGDLGAAPTLHVLQIRPMTLAALDAAIDDADLEGEVLCRSDRALGHGRIKGVRDVVYVKAGEIDAARSKAAAADVGRINADLRAESAPYLLIGPGRWGTADPTLGIPVEWSQITGARVLIETRINGRAVEPSQGTHFFQNVTSLRIGYLTVAADEKEAAEEFIDLAWLDGQPAMRETQLVRHVRLDAPLGIRIDGRRGSAVLSRPKAT
jgi:CheY-like chemotaxis protein